MITSLALVPPARGTHHVQSLAPSVLPNTIVGAADLALLRRLRLLVVLGSWSLLHLVIHDLHWAAVNLRQVVVLDGAGRRRSLAVDDSGSAQVPTKLVHIKRSTNERTALSKELLQILSTHSSLIDTSHTEFALGKRALDLHSVVVIVYLVVIGHDRGHRLALLQTIGSISVVLKKLAYTHIESDLRFAHWQLLRPWCRESCGSAALTAVFVSDSQHPGSTGCSQ